MGDKFQAAHNAAKFIHLNLATQYALRHKYWPPVILGDDGRFWVPANNREAGILLNAGYEEA
jgi:hypothetical protein